MIFTYLYHRLSLYFYNVFENLVLKFFQTFMNHNKPIKNDLLFLIFCQCLRLSTVATINEKLQTNIKFATMAICNNILLD